MRNPETVIVELTPEDVSALQSALLFQGLHGQRSPAAASLVEKVMDAIADQGDLDPADRALYLASLVARQGIEL